MFYLDHNAGQPLIPGVLEAMQRAAAIGGNPSSLHAIGRAARRVVDDTSDAVRSLVGASQAEVIFTASGAEANALAILGAARAHAPEGCVLATLDEHASVEFCLAQLTRQGRLLHRVELTHDLTISADVAVATALLANGRDGAVRPVERLAQRGWLLHTDAAQAAGKISLSFDALGVDAMTISGHKFGAPRGVGALVIKKGLRLAPLWQGGGQHQGLRSGTEAVALIAGLGAAARAWLGDGDHAVRIAVLRDALEAGLAAVQDVCVLACPGPRLPNTCLVRVTHEGGAQWVQDLSARGVMVGDGGGGTLCFSLGWSSTAADVDAAVEAMGDVARSKREGV